MRGSSDTGGRDGQARGVGRRLTAGSDKGSDLAELSAVQVRRQVLPRQVRDTIAAVLLGQDSRAGHPLPSESVLAERLEVSRSTIREAMKLLEEEGLVETRRGMGRFVSALADLRPERPMTEFESITEMMRELGYKATTTVVEVIQRLATASERMAFALKAGSQVVETRRLRVHKGKPCVYSVNVLDLGTLDAPVDSIDWSGSVVELLERMGYEILGSSAHISAVGQPRDQDVLSGIDLPPGPWLLVSERCVTRDGRCVLLSRDYHDGEMFSFSVVRRRENRPRSGAGIP
jgi:GntR family transcriptional regulator